MRILTPFVRKLSSGYRVYTDGGLRAVGNRIRANVRGGVSALYPSTNVYERSWDVLVVLDGCRYDLFTEVAPDYDYAVLEGFPEASIPRVVLGGDGPGEGTTVATAPDPDALDLDDVIDRLRDLEPYVTLESLVASVKRSSNAERAGAIATFTGRVRARDGDDDEPTEFLEFEKYEGVAEQRMDRLETELAEREGVQKVRLHHRTGRIPYGEDIVFVVVLAGHREEAFRTVEDGINRLKDEVPIFKREVTVEEEFWVHQRD